MIYEPDLLKAIVDGDEQEYKLMYNYYFKKLYNYGRKLTDDVSLIEDTIQETFLVLWSNRRLLKDVTSSKSYLFTIFRNRIGLHYKKLKRIEQLNIINLSDEIEFSTEHFIIDEEKGVEIQKKLKSAIEKLTDRQREMIFLKFYENLSYEEASEILGITTKGGYKLMARAINDLKLHLNIPTSLIIILIKSYFQI